MAEEAPIEPLEMAAQSHSIQRTAKPEESRQLVPISTQGGLMPPPFSDSLKQLKEIRGEAAMILLWNHAIRLEGELREVGKEKKHLAKTSEDWMKSYYDEKERSAVLRTQLKGVSLVKNIQKCVGAVGGMIAGVAFSALLMTPTGWSISGAILGAVLFLVGFWPSSVREKEK